MYNGVCINAALLYHIAPLLLMTLAVYSRLTAFKGWRMYLLVFSVIQRNAVGRV
jgi:hypothetical protein